MTAPTPPTRTKTYIVCTVRGGLVPHEDIEHKEVDGRDPDRDAKYPPFLDTLSFHYYDVELTEANPDGKPVPRKSDRQNRSLEYVINGKFLSAKQLTTRGDRDDLVVDMQREGWRNVVEYEGGGFAPGPGNQYALVLFRK